MDNLFVKTTRHTSQPIKIDVVEEMYKATFVGDFCLKLRDGSWTDHPIAIFYQPNPDIEAGHSHYFGVHVTHQNQIYLTDGKSAFENGITGAIADNGEVIFSRFRHNFVSSQDGSISIDGGRDYTKLIGSNPNRTVKLVINKDKLEIDPESIRPEALPKLNRITTLTIC